MAANSILIVDDIPRNIQIIFEFLAHCGYTVRIAQSGEQALEILHKSNIDLVLMDILMPGIDGLETCRRMHADEKLRDIPVIFMTALGDFQSKLQGFEAGGVDYVIRPVQREELLARIKTHLSLRDLQQRLQEQNRQLCTEVSVRKRMEHTLEVTARQLEERGQELQKRNQELEAFSRTVAHDLKNPLGSIISLHHLMQEQLQPNEPLLEETLEQIHLIGDAAQRAFNIIDALLVLARTSHEQVPRQILEMGAVFHEVLHEQNMGRMLKEHQGQIDYPREWPKVCGYGPWVHEIWINYLSNAIKYGGRPPHIQVGTDELSAEGQIRFWVRDNGPGLAPDAQRKLFAPFVRLHRERAEGHGLGLTIVHQIVEKLQGDVGVESTPGRGRLFYFTLPMARW